MDEPGVVSLDDAMTKVVTMASEAEDSVSSLPVRNGANKLNLDLTPMSPDPTTHDVNTPQTPADIRAKLEVNHDGEWAI